MKIRYQSREDAIESYGIWENDLVLDVGCGPGPVSQCREDPTASHFQRADVITDFRPELVAVHRDRMLVAEEEGRFYPPFVLSSAEALPFKDKAFQFVWCSNVLEHVDDPEIACEELIRVGDRGQIRTPSPAKEFFRPNPDHIWFTTWDGDLLIFQKKSLLFFHHAHLNLVHHPKVVEWYDARKNIGGLPVKAHETTFDWVEGFSVEVYD